MASKVACSLILAVLILVGAADGGSIPIDDFRDISDWSINGDGGFIVIQADAENTRGPNPSMRLVFDNAKHDYGNAARQITLPPNTTGVEFDLYVNKAGDGAGLSVWFFEPDGDGHHAWVRPDGKQFSETERGWYACFVPIKSFRFDPRGNRVNELLSANKILIGINSGVGDISVCNLAFRTADQRAQSEPAEPEAPRIEDGSRGRVAILKDNFEHLAGDSDPQVLAHVLRKSGYGVTLLAAAHLADPSILSADIFDCLVLPYGPRYPQVAAACIKAYMEGGGSIFTTGGYAFDEPCALGQSTRKSADDEVVTAEDLAEGKVGPQYINTRHGKPDAHMTSGTLTHIWPDQVSMFDPGYHLKHVHRVASSPGQHVLTGIDLADIQVEGYAACSMLGSNDPVFPEKWGRHVSLVDALDSQGRVVGSAGAIAHVYAGPYAGSSWAFFGVRNLDLFTKGSPLLARLPAIVDAITKKTYLHSLESELACYRDGEIVRLSCVAVNFGRADARAAVQFRIYDRAGKMVWESSARQVTLKPGGAQTITAEFGPGRFTDDLYRVVAEMTAANRAIDSMETGFAVYRPDVIAQGFDLSLKNNYFHDGGRPVLLSGTNVTGSVFFSGNENPLVWDRDLARMNECGLNIIRVLHFSPFLSEKPSFDAIKAGDLDVDRLPIKTERKLDALAQLCQKHKIILFLTLHDWMAVDLSPEELAVQRKFARLIAQRYKDFPGFMLDIENEPMLALPFEARPNERKHVVDAWNDYLRSKYGTDEALKNAWTMSPPEAPLGSIPYRAGTPAWEDMRTYDADFFRALLANKWIEANTSGAKEGNPDVLVTLGFLQEYYALNKVASVDGQDFANTHSYANMDVLRCDLKLLDRRFQGKSLTLGEFGSVRDYQMRMAGHDNPGQDYPRYLATGHYLFGLGGSFLANWCWKDADDVIFAWGINYSCGGPAKDILKAYRNQSLLMRQVRPVYKPAEVYLVLPVDQMTGEQRTKMVPTYYQVVETLLASQVQFDTIDDRHLSLLPESAKVLVYPAPFAVPDDAYEHLKSFVERGGTLCITGDISYDSLRRRTRTDRLLELAGVWFVSENYSNIAWDEDCGPCINVQPAGAVVDNGVYVNRLGAGEVRYTPRPMGVTETAGEYLYTRPVVGLENGVVNAPGVHAFRIPESGGARTIILVNPDLSEKSVPVSERGCTSVQITLRSGGVGMVRFDASGSVVALESQGPATIGDNLKIPMKGHFALVACDNKSIRVSRQLMIIPFGGGEVDLSPLTGASGLIVQAGEVTRGRWHPLFETSDLKIVASAENDFDIRIAAARHNLPALGEFVASEMMLTEPKPNMMAF